jgi:hypothetical protein
MLHCNTSGSAYLPVTFSTIEPNNETAHMSKQLAISAAFSVFAMAAFVLSATPDQSAAGAKAFAPAPATFEIVVDLAAIAD